MTPPMTAPSREVLLALAERCEKATGADNALDVEIEVALFEAGSRYTAIRANAAGTKVIYRYPSGQELTHWARDYTLTTAHRAHAAAALRARATLDGSRADG